VIVQQQVISSSTCQRYAGKATLDELDRRDVLKGSDPLAIIVLERLPEWAVVPSTAEHASCNIVCWNSTIGQGHVAKGQFGKTMIDRLTDRLSAFFLTQTAGLLILGAILTLKDRVIIHPVEMGQVSQRQHVKKLFIMFNPGFESLVFTSYLICTMLLLPDFIRMFISDDHQDGFESWLTFVQRLATHSLSCVTSALMVRSLFTEDFRIHITRYVTEAWRKWAGWRSAASALFR
jgi:hypothetical protein